MRAVPSSRKGMGSIPYPGGVTFRVWAPNARLVEVYGSWSDASIPLAPEKAAGQEGIWSADIPGASINDGYIYLIHTPGGVLKRCDPYARRIDQKSATSLITTGAYHWDDATYQTPPWDRMVIYEMHIGTFNDLPGGPVGRLEGVMEKIPYLKNLGINTIEIMPPCEFRGSYSWGYNPGHLFAVEEAYGGPQALKKMINCAHQNGIAVIMDVVYNHLGIEDNLLWRYDGSGEAGGIYFYNDHRRQTPWGERPNYSAPRVRNYIRDNAMNWLDEYRMDGLRWDASLYIRNWRGWNSFNEAFLPDGWQLMQFINDEIDTHQPWKISIAEDMQNEPRLTQATRGGGAGFDSQWDAGFVHPVRSILAQADDAHRNMYTLADAITHLYNGNPLERVIFTESHDEVANGKARLPEEIFPGHADNMYAKKRSTLGAAIMFTSPGIPMIFQGQEFLEDAWFSDQDPLDWRRQERFAGITQLYRDLIHLRRNFYGRTAGLTGANTNIYYLSDRDKIMAIHRWKRGGPRDSVVVVLNLSNRAYGCYTLGFPAPGLWKLRFNSDFSAYDPDFLNCASNPVQTRNTPMHNQPCCGDVGIGPYTAVIFSQD